MRAAGALARRRRVAVGALPGAPLAGTFGGSLAPAVAARPLFGIVKRWAGVPERDEQIKELRAENAAHMEALGDLQSELQRTRGELSAAQKRMATLQAEKASLSAGRAQAALAAEERAARAEAAVDLVRSRMAELHRLTAPAAVAGSSAHQFADALRGVAEAPAPRSSAKARAAAAAAASAALPPPAPLPPPKLATLRQSVQAALDDVVAASAAGPDGLAAPLAAPASAEDDKRRGAGAGSALQPSAAPRWVKRLTALAVRSKAFPTTLGGRPFGRPEHVWAFCERALADAVPGEDLRARDARVVLELLRRGGAADWAAAHAALSSTSGGSGGEPPLRLRVEAAAAAEGEAAPQKDGGRAFALSRAGWQAADGSPAAPAASARVSYQKALHALAAGRRKGAAAAAADAAAEEEEEGGGGGDGAAEEEQGQRSDVAPTPARAAPAAAAAAPALAAAAAPAGAPLSPQQQRAAAAAVAAAGAARVAVVAPPAPRPGTKELSGWATQAFPVGAALLQAREPPPAPLEPRQHAAL